MAPSSSVGVKWASSNALNCMSFLEMGFVFDLFGFVYLARETG